MRYFVFYLNTTSTTQLLTKIRACLLKMVVFLSLFISFNICLLATAQECSDDDIRIINGTVTMNGNTFNMAGGLQICVNNIWATVCQDGWHDVEGRVACRQLGLNYTGSKSNYSFQHSLFKTKFHLFPHK